MGAKQGKGQLLTGGGDIVFQGVELGGRERAEICSAGISGFWSPMDSTGVLKSDLPAVPPGRRRYALPLG